MTKTVFVGLSGGVDSSVAALRLLRAGHSVVGVFIKVWHPTWLVCNWEAERLDAMRVAAKLGIPFLTCDAEAAYRDEVASYFIREYEAGRTPNPDVLCNQHVKFGAFLEFARAHGADAIATGHYVRREDGEGEVRLLRGIDPKKDQSYFLWSLSKEQLTQALFPVGDTPKETVRQEASAAGLITAKKRDSQGICFLGHIDIREFLSHYLDLREGVVLDTSGRAIGTHHGAIIYTLGQRQGFQVTEGPTAGGYYVVSRDIAANTITVNSERPVPPPQTTLNITNTVLRERVSVGDTLTAETRYHQPPLTVTVVALGESTLTLELQGAGEVGDGGQSCVLYRGDCCIGGGIIAGWQLP